MLISAEHITKSFGTRQVLRDVSLSVDEGQAVALLGTNGSGKTTLLRIIVTLLKPDAGQVLFCDHPMLPADLRQVGYLPEERGLYRHMRAGEQAIYLLRLKGLSYNDAAECARSWFVRLGMEQWWNRPVGKLSKGMQQRLQFVVSVAHNPRLLILDEPFSGFDQDNAAMLQREIARLRDAGTAIILSTHNTQAASQLCNLTVHLTPTADE